MVSTCNVPLRSSVFEGDWIMQPCAHQLGSEAAVLKYQAVCSLPVCSWDPHGSGWGRGIQHMHPLSFSLQPQKNHSGQESAG